VIDSTTTAPTVRADLGPGPLVLADYRAELKIASLGIAGCALALLALVAWPAIRLHWPVRLDVPTHTLLETVSIVVAALVFSVGWYTWGRHRASSVALLCNAFLAAAVLQFVHVLSFEGMPVFVTASGPGKAIVFSLAARLLVAGALLALALMPWRCSMSAAARGWLVALSLVFAVAVALAGLYDQRVPRLLLDPVSGPTPLKVGAGYVIVLLDLAAAAGFLALLRQPRRTSAVSLFAAATMAALAELCFGLYTDPRDAFGLLGHVYQLAAYLLVYRALFVNLVRVPYQRLESARRALQASEEQYRRLFEHAQGLNASLELRVRQRTAELEAANEELEHFAHAIAHDLRAPLAATAAFGAALARELGPPSARAQHLLGRIAASVARMEEMIQAMLELSQLSRCVPRRELLDLSALARQVLAACREREPARRVEFEVEEGIHVRGDRRLLTLALENLLGNAWKFTSGRPDARISFGKEWHNGELVCVVQDNGAGFDMAYAGKLFVMFQRLHSVTEFPGHGIGLANVQRIVARHGGRIWAEAAPGAGATFRFTLGGTPAG